MSAKPRDMEVPVSIRNLGPAFEFLHNGEFYQIAEGHSVVSAFIAERVVRRMPAVVYGGALPEPVVESSSDSVTPEPAEPAEPVIPELPAVKPELAEPAEVVE